LCGPLYSRHKFMTNFAFAFHAPLLVDISWPPMSAISAAAELVAEYTIATGKWVNIIDWLVKMISCVSAAAESSRRAVRVGYNNASHTIISDRRSLKKLVCPSTRSVRPALHYEPKIWNKIYYVRNVTYYILE